MNSQSGPCSRDNQSRALKGVWVTPEFNKALEMGYHLSKKKKKSQRFGILTVTTIQSFYSIDDF